MFTYVKDKKIPGQEPYYLPEDIYIANGDKASKTGTPKLFKDGDTFEEVTTKEITFNSNGSCSNQEDLYIVGKCNNGKIESGQSYYIISINDFTGRITTTYREVE